MGEPQVGTATQKNSPEANKEQFVKLIFKTKSFYRGQAIDNTDAMITGGINKIEQKKLTTQFVKVCYSFPSDIYNVIKDKLKKYEI
jgi:hypothetical protein